MSPEPRSFLNDDEPQVLLLTGDACAAAMDAAMRAGENLDAAIRLGIGIEEATLARDAAVENLARLLAHPEGERRQGADFQMEGRQ